MRENNLLREAGLQEDLTLLGPRWRIARIKLKDGNIKSILGTLKSIKSVISKVKGLLSSIRQYAQILSMIEQLISDPVQKIIQKIITQLEKSLKSLGSGGFYFLSTLDYTKVNIPITIEQVEGISTTSQVVSSSTISMIDYLTELAGGVNIIDERYVQNNTRTMEDFDERTLSLRIGNTKYSFGNHRPITYAEWISCIAEAFIDPLDLPPSTFIGNYRRIEAQISENKKDASPFEILFASGNGAVKTGNYKIFSNEPAAIIKTGKPFIEPGTRVDIIIIGAAFPDIGAFMSNLKILSRMFTGLLPRKKTEQEEKEIQERIKLIKDAEAADKQKRKENSKGLYDDITSGFLSLNDDLIKANPASPGLLPGALRSFVDAQQAAGNLITGGAEPDFYGINIRGLLLPLFQSAEELLFNAKNFVTPTLTMGDLIDKYIAAIEDVLGMIEIMINKIENLIEDILSLLALNISVLKIQTTQGADDIYEKILSSQGFPTAGVQKEFFHFGLAFCSVIPTAKTQNFQNLANIDMKKYWDEQQKEYDGDLRKEVQNLGGGIQDLQKLLGI